MNFNPVLLMRTVSWILQVWVWLTSIWVIVCTTIPTPPDSTILHESNSNLWIIALFHLVWDTVKTTSSCIGYLSTTLAVPTYGLSVPMNSLQPHLIILQPVSTAELDQIPCSR